MPRPLSLRQIQAGFNRLRRRYFLDAGPPLHIPPLASEFRWGWLPANSDAVAETLFDEDGDAEELRLAPQYADRWSILRTTLLHELTHMRLGVNLPRYPGPSCGAWHPGAKLPKIAASSVWRRETLRLASLGALQL